MSGTRSLLATALAIQFAIATSALSAADPADPLPAPTAESRGVLAEGIIVRLAPIVGDTLCDALDLINDLLPLVDLVKLDCFDGRYWLRVPAGVLVDPLLDILNASALVEYASRNYINQHPERENFQSFAWGGQTECPLSGPDAWREQPAWQAMDFESVHEIATGDGIAVAIIDSGVWHEHPLVQGRIHPASEDLLDDDQGYGEALAHGTHVAGIVALAAPGAQMIDLRVLDADGTGHDFYTAKAVWLAVNAGAQVLNLSLGSKARKPPILHDVFTYAAEHDVLITGAAGNLGEAGDLEPGERQYPAAENCALGVAALDAEFELAEFSNRGNWVAFQVPGEAIYSALHDDGNGNAWGCWSGTSMATPFVTGTAALMRAANPALSAPEIAAYLAYTAGASDPANAAYGVIHPAGAVTQAVAHRAVPVFSPLNTCPTYFGWPEEEP